MKRCVFLIMRSKIYILFNILIFCTNCSMDLLLQYYLLSHVLLIQLHRYCHFHLLHKLQQGLESSISFLTYLYHRIQSRLFHFEWNIHIFCTNRSMDLLLQFHELGAKICSCEIHARIETQQKVILQNDSWSIDTYMVLWW